MAKAKPAKKSRAAAEAKPAFTYMDVEYIKDCVVLVSGAFKLAITTQVGPRIIGGWLKGGENLFRVMPDAPVENCDTGFKLYGGHRLWHAPEAMPRSYAPDNAPVTVRETCDGVEFSSGVEPLTGIEKSIIIEPLGNERFRVAHRLVNRNAWEVELAPWALSVMAPGGMAVIPQKRSRGPAADRFTSDRSLVAWSYTDLNDPRLTLGKDYIFLRQDAKAKEACKIGFNAESGWVAYVNAGTALVKCFETFDAQYPDNGCNVESYSCKEFCEIETLAPMHTLEPGEAAEHIEYWLGLANLPAIKSEADVKKHLEPAIA
ncbi:MAG: hypothetical protein WC789_06085 [Lentisphaeria bacterium]|jgi:hypothetical protein